MAKEILKDEMLSDEELEQVAGGTIAETVKDTQFLHALGLINRAYTASEVQSNPAAVDEVINGALWSIDGGHNSWIEMGVNVNSANHYGRSYIEDNEPPEKYSRKYFLAEVCELAGKPNFDYTPYL